MGPQTLYIDKNKRTLPSSLLAKSTTTSSHFRLEPHLGARKRQPSQPSHRPRSHSPHYPGPSSASSLRVTRGPSPSLMRAQQSRSLDERRSRISRQRNTSYSQTWAPEEAEARLMAPGPPNRPPGQAPAPPVITLRRPSLTCLPLEPGLKCSDPLYRATFLPGGQSFNCNISKVSRSKSRKPTYCLKFSAIRMERIKCTLPCR